MNQESCVVVVGLGEVGRPLRELLSEHYNVVGVDIAPPSAEIGKVSVLHLCFPFEIPDFVGEAVRYIEKFRPEVAVVNSTVAVGTTRKIASRTSTPVVNSPVRGKHVRMLEEMRHYTKFIGTNDPAAGQQPP